MKVSRSLRDLDPASVGLLDCIVTFSGMDKDTGSYFATVVGEDDLGRRREDAIATIYPSFRFNTAEVLRLRGYKEQNGSGPVFKILEIVDRRGILEPSYKSNTEA